MRCTGWRSLRLVRLHEAITAALNDRYRFTTSFSFIVWPHTSSHCDVLHALSCSVQPCFTVRFGDGVLLWSSGYDGIWHNGW
jgi:hypothetical protein